MTKTTDNGGSGGGGGGGNSSVNNLNPTSNTNNQNNTTSSTAAPTTITTSCFPSVDRSNLCPNLHNYYNNHHQSSDNNSGGGSGVGGEDALDLDGKHESNGGPPFSKSYNSAQDTIYLCNFRVSVDGDWLCLRQLEDVEVPMQRPPSYYETLPSSPEFIPFYDRDPSSVERSNLLNITKLVIKELIEWSIRHGRSLESDHPPLQHFFIVLEHAMRHGLKPKKGLLGPKKELWDVLQLVERCTQEAQDITSSIRDLPTVSTHLGRARAWLRLALMQKKLADYFKILVDRREEMLPEFYEPFALLMSDEAPVLGGLLVGLNVIDCNFCLKEEDLDSQQGVIDFSLYLRSSRSSESQEDEGDHANDSKFDTVLDQKNYIEELNRHLNATVTNLQTRLETLTTTNALMKEDLAISKNTILALQDENRQLKTKRMEEEKLSVERHSSPHSSDTEVDAALNEKEGVIPVAQAQLLQSPSEATLTLSVQDLSKKLHDERMKTEQLEIEVENERRLKEEMETAMKLMEKDVHEKQDTIISLRSQLDDIKMINLEMYRKLQVKY
ncbi:unnamed protein product [Orchesella dallaii]|uniref:RUN domain-containing protein n=1 Tax=Orchesella dallaii TaxID=48710 RepID=A0ABP1PUI6_9HEXA